MRIVDVLYTFPFLILVILLMVFFANDQSSFFKVFRWGLGAFVAHPEDPSYFPIFKSSSSLASSAASPGSPWRASSEGR
jgi:oligopeptide transport system permease protein